MGSYTGQMSRNLLSDCKTNDNLWVSSGVAQKVATQISAGLLISGAMRSIPTSAIKAILNLFPPEIRVIAEARIATHHLNGYNYWKTEPTAGHASIREGVLPIQKEPIPDTTLTVHLRLPTQKVLNRNR